VGSWVLKTQLDRDEYEDRSLEHMSYKSDEPVSKFIIKVWPPTETGDRNSTSPCCEVALTSPSSSFVAALICGAEVEDKNGLGGLNPHFR
jgi:hypothetical protein